MSDAMQVDAITLRAVAAAIYAEDDVWSAAILFDDLDEMDRSAYERIARAAIRARSAGSSASQEGGA